MTIVARAGSAVAAASLLLAGTAVVVAPTAQAHTTGIHDNCTNLNKKWAHGVGRDNARDRTSGTPVRNFKRSTRLYKRAVNHNSDLDRDGDGIACEKA